MTTSTTDAEAIARKAVTRIIDDLTDRRGLRHAWDGIDDNIRAEIESTWTMIIRTSLASRREAQEPVAWLRDLDGTGSLHPASQGDPEAFAVYRTAPPAPAGEVERLRGEIAYALTKRLVIDMPTARAAIDEAFAALNGGRADE